MMQQQIKILLVDDDEVERRALLRGLTLNYNQYEVVQACTAEEAFVYLENMRFDVVIMDYHMPRIDGIEAIIRLRNIPHLRHTAIILVSNNSDEQLMLDCINAGAQDFLLKSDVTESQLARTILQSQKRNELEQQLFDSYQQVKHLAERDKLTGLHNRYYFDEALTQLLLNQKRHQCEMTAVILFDLDKFKQVNDTFGHETGDKLLIAVTQRLRKVLRGDELFARLGGDEFVLACSQLKSVREIKSVASRILRTFIQSFAIDEHSVFCSASLGIAIAPANGDKVADLLKLSDIAMYRAKQSSKLKYCIFEDNMQRAFLRKYKIESELRSAIQHKEFKLVFQPVYSASGETLVGAEALLRWPKGHTTQKPSEFIPVAEEAGLIHAIGKWVIQQACEHYAGLLHQLPANQPFYMSINASPCQLCDSEFVEFVQSILTHFSISSSCLVLEVTETAFLDQDEHTLATLSALSQMGIKIALDDFGTGYSSISHLLTCPIDLVKIDKSIVQNTVDPTVPHKDMLEGLCFMLRKLGMQIIAEGVELPEQARVCEELGIEMIQGFLYAKPRSMASFKRLLGQQLSLRNESPR